LSRLSGIVIVFLLLVWEAAKALSADAQTFPEPVLKQWSLENFHSYQKTWHTYAQDSNSQVRIALATSRRPGEHGRALHLSYHFTTPAAAEAGFRIKLDKLDASDYDHLAFWVKGDRHRGYADAFKVEFRRPDPEVPGMEERGSFVVTGITDHWRRVVIPLNFMTGIRDWTQLTEFVIGFQARRSPIRRGAYSIEDITLLKTGQRGPSVQDPVVPIRKKAWEAALGGQEAAQPYIQARLAGWPGRALVDRRTLPAGDRDFLRQLARDTWRGLVALSDREHGLPLDYVRFGKGTTATAAAHLGDYTNITNIGLYLLNGVAAFELQFIDRQQALAMLGTTLATLEHLETWRGFFYNFYDTTTLERTSHFVSFVDSSWLTAGLIVVRMTFPELYDRCTRLINQGDYGFFYDPVVQQMHQGYYVNLPSYSEYHYGVLYTESRLGSLLAIGKGDVPAEHWFRLVRTFPAADTWQSLQPRARRLKAVDGYPVVGGYYQWHGFRYVPSWGGSLFEALMPTLVLDEPRYAPANLGKNDELHAALQRRYALDELGYPVWGLSSSATPDRDGYTEYGVKILGSRGYKAGAVAPYAAALALAVTPEPAVANLRELARRYELYGEYGFYDAVDPLSGKVAYKYLALDQSMLFLALANYLQDHCLQKHFAADPIVRRALPVIAQEHFFD
jgi:hypothetical protein